jgi:hypothetical protein
MTITADLLDSDWSDLGPGPILLSTKAPRGILCAVTTAKPSSLNAPAHHVDGSGTIGASGKRVYARSVSGPASAVVSPASSGAADPAGTTPAGFETIADLSFVKALSPPPGATVATAIPEGGGVRIRKDGVDPTPTVGTPIPLGGGVKLYGDEIAAARFIQQGAAAVLNVEYGK